MGPVAPCPSGGGAGAGQAAVARVSASGPGCPRARLSLCARLLCEKGRLLFPRESRPGAPGTKQANVSGRAWVTGVGGGGAGSGPPHTARGRGDSASAPCIRQQSGDGHETHPSGSGRGARGPAGLRCHCPGLGRRGGGLRGLQGRGKPPAARGPSSVPHGQPRQPSHPTDRETEAQTQTIGPGSEGPGGPSEHAGASP